MASRIIEFFGHDPQDKSTAAKQARTDMSCPFIADTCQKTLNDGAISGACTLKPVKGGPVIICPVRLYAGKYAILTDIAKEAFGGDVELVPGHVAKTRKVAASKTKVAVFGKKWGKELRLPNRGDAGGYFVDWVLAKLDDKEQLEEFVAVEVQSIDTTGNYRAERLAYLAEKSFKENSTAGFNWENVNKRILPQLIYKGHVLRRERLCRKGLFFVCPTPVYEKVSERLGGKLLDYGLQPGSLSFMWYDVSASTTAGQVRALEFKGKLTTTVDQVALAFTSPSNLPPANVYELAIKAAL